jgi:hypothetical protein
MRKLTQPDKWKLFGIACTLVAGLWWLWITDLSDSNIILHIKFIYSLFLFLAIAVSAYYLVLKEEDKKNGKRK